MHDPQLTVRIKYEIDGTVQGVGFRPAMYRLATEAGLGGWIQNRSGAVRLCLEGTPEKIGNFVTLLHTKLPQQASIDQIHQLNKEVINSAEIAAFEIIESETGNAQEVVIPADLAMCADCAREIMDCEDRRFGYPFTTCTNCGPRYTVVNEMPYDRERTTLNEFPLCEKCQKEYEDPNNRRFHAESTACPECGPQLELSTTDAPALSSLSPGDSVLSNNKTLLAVRAKLANGDIAAIRGIGGYLLACDAFNKETIKTLRKRKNRPAKPFAVMFRNIETVLKYCKFNPEAVKLLMSTEAPIVILDTQNDRGQRSEVRGQKIPLDDLSPDCHTLGALVPYSPLHKLLFEPIGDDPTPAFEALIMTSGNRGGEPICITNEEAKERLDSIADCFLTHNREINLRNDDSLCAIQLGQPQVWRRARGYAPRGIRISNIEQGISNSQGKETRTSNHRPATTKTSGPVVLAMGAELKNSVAMAYGDEIVMSPHIGDLEAPEALAGLEQVVECFPKFLDKKPELIVVDLHPDMQSTRLGRTIAEEKNIPVIVAQHHHAHAAACMGEHGLSKAIALTFDGTGLGPDGTIWGAECFAVNFTAEEQFQRLATFAPVPLLGGDTAVYHPVRQLAARYHNAGFPKDKICNKLRNYKSYSNLNIDLLLTQLEKRINSPLSHATGRLFDAISIMLGIAPEDVSYEGQSAIALEGAAKSATDSYPFNLKFEERENNGMLIIDWAKLFANFAETDQVNEYALAFHQAVANSAVRMVEFARDKFKIDDVVLTGGVFMNRILTETVYKQLGDKGLKVHLHQQVPPNDGGIAFGQAVIGRYTAY